MTDNEVYCHLLQLAKNANGLESSIAKQIFNIESPVNRSLLANIIWSRGSCWVINPFRFDSKYAKDALVVAAFDKEQMARLYTTLIDELQMGNV